MRDHLVFRLYGAMASWGDIAVGEYRPSQPHPTRSAIMGLLAGALGLRRDDEDAHRELDASLGLATRVFGHPALLRDYHTIQAARQLRGRSFYTRKDEVAVADQNAIISQRDYYCDAVYDVCVWPAVDSPPRGPDQLKSALKRPQFVPYLGRKACPLAISLEPQCIEAEHFLQAFAEARFSLEDILKDELPAVDRTTYFWEGDPSHPLKALQTVTRRDRVLSRRRWQFTARDEHVHIVDGRE